MNKSQKRAIVATLIRAGRQDLVSRFIEAANGPKTKELIDRIRGLLQQHNVKLTSSQVADNLTLISFRGKFDKNAKAKDPERYGGLGGRPVEVEIRVAPGRQIWVTMVAYKKSLGPYSLMLPNRSLDTLFSTVERGVNDMFRQVLR